MSKGDEPMDATKTKTISETTPKQVVDPYARRPARPTWREEAERILSPDWDGTFRATRVNGR